MDKFSQREIVFYYNHWGEIVHYSQLPFGLTNDDGNQEARHLENLHGASHRNDF